MPNVSAGRDGGGTLPPMPKLRNHASGLVLSSAMPARPKVPQPRERIVGVDHQVLIEVPKQPPRAASVGMATSG